MLVSLGLKAAGLILPSISKWWFIGLGAIAIVTAIGLGYLHYSSIVSENASLKVEQAQLKGTVEAQHGTINAQRNAISQWAEAERRMTARMEELATAQQEARSETRRLNDLFRKHNIGKLAKAKPGLIEDRINAGTLDAMRLLECATSATGSC